MHIFDFDVVYLIIYLLDHNQVDISSFNVLLISDIVTIKIIIITRELWMEFTSVVWMWIILRSIQFQFYTRHINKFMVYKI